MSYHNTMNTVMRELRSMEADLENNNSLEELAGIAKFSGAIASMRSIKSGNYSNRYLYFIQCGDLVKIGVSNDVENRIKTLQPGSPGKMTLIKSIKKSGHLESYCHKKLLHLKVYGEWFLLTDEVYKLINKLSTVKI